MEKNMENLIATLFLSGYGLVSLLIFGVGIFIIHTIRKGARQLDASQGWSATTGRITEAYVHRNLGVGYKHLVHVSYEYQLLGQSYAGAKVAFGVAKSYQFRSQAENALACYPLDSQVTVYYDPANPAEAVLERKVGDTSKTPFVKSLGVIAIFLGLGNFCQFIFIVLATAVGTLTRSK